MHSWEHKGKTSESIKTSKLDVYRETYKMLGSEYEDIYAEIPGHEKVTGIYKVKVAKDSNIICITSVVGWG